MQNKNLVQENVENFNRILDMFFSKKELTFYSYFFEKNFETKF